MKNDTVEEILDRIMRPQETLDSRIFDYKEEMLPEVREGLLRLANRVIRNVFVQIKGLEVYDICLSGSTASYFYHDKSDIDMRIEIHNKNCPFLPKDPALLDAFLSAMSGSFHRKGNSERYNGRFVDIKCSAKPVEIIGLYSVLKNKWRIYPNRDIYAKFSKEEILDMYYARKAKIEADVENFKQTLSGVTLGRRLADYYEEQFDLYANFKSYLVFKLLSKTKLLRSLGANSIRIQCRALSLFTEDEQEKIKTLDETERASSDLAEDRLN